MTIENKNPVQVESNRIIVEKTGPYLSVTHERRTIGTRGKERWETESTTDFIDPEPGEQTKSNE